jgi:hypothetical protein
MSSMLSAPATMPATSAGTFKYAFGAGTLNLSVTRPASPQDSANAMTGSRPAQEIRFGSSKLADIAAGV